MLTPTQKRRFDLYKKLRSLAKVAEQEGVSRESIRKCLASMPESSPEYIEFRAIASAEKGGRPMERQVDQKTYRRDYMRWYRAKLKAQSS